MWKRLHERAAAIARDPIRPGESRSPVVHPSIETRRSERPAWPGRVGLAVALTVCTVAVFGCAGDASRRDRATGPRAIPALADETASLDGAALFDRFCATCHLGGGGLLGSPRTPDLFEDALPRGETIEAITQAVRYGIDPPRMPAFEGGLEASEIETLSRWIIERRRQTQARYSGDHMKRSPAPNR